MADLIGRQIGPYEIRESLGKSETAEAYLAYQGSLDRLVVLRLLPEALAGGESFTHAFKQIALAAAELRHPNILPVYDAGTLEGRPYLVTGYAPGGTLAARLKQGALGPDAAAEMGAQIAEALDYAHRRNVVHGGLTPEHVLLDGEGRPLVADLGIPRAWSGGPAGTQAGAAEYLSPEQAQGLPVDERTDLYSLGVVLYQMLAGSVPFSAATPVATLYQVVNQQPPPLHVFNAAVPQALENVVLRAVAKRPEERFQSGREMAEALRTRRMAPAPVEQPVAPVVTAPPVTAAAADTHAPVRAPAGKRRGLPVGVVALLVVAALALAVVAAMLLTRMGVFPGQQVAVVPSPTAVRSTEPPTEPPPSPTPVVIQQIVEKVVTATPEPTSTPEPPTATTRPTATRPEPSPTATEEPSATPSLTPVPPTTTPTTVPPTATKAATLTVAPTASRASAPGMVFDFESLGTWRRGDQPNGTLEKSADRKHEGSYAARLDYTFPGGEQNFVVFMPRPAIPIPGQPAALSAWVYGDGSNSFLNAWVQDAQGEVRQFSFGRVSHKDRWQAMTARLDTAAAWPQGHISGPDSGKLEYPVSLYALVLDGQGSGAGQGAIYVDELVVGALATPQPTGTAAPAAAEPTATPKPAAGLSGRIVFPAVNEGRIEIMAVDAATKSVWTVHPFGSAPRLRSDGRVLFNGIGGGKDNLVTVLVDGSVEVIIGRHPEDAYPDWSPSGESAVFYSTFGAGHDEKIYIQRNAGAAEDAVPLQMGGQDVLGRFPTWLDNWRIAYSGCDYWSTGSHCGIWTLESDGSGHPARLSEQMDDRATDARPGSVLFASRTPGNWEVFSVADGGGTPRNLTNSPSQDFGAAYSPDGQWIAFASDRDGWGIWVMPANGAAGATKLIAVPGGFGQNWADERLSWGP